MKALWHININESIIKEAALPSGQKMVVQSLYSLISLGTERLVAKGMIPPNLYPTMEVPYMEGTLGLPVKYGYSLVGKVLESTQLEKGSLIHIMHPHQDYAYIDEQNSTLIPVEIPAKRAILVSNMETTINAIWDANLLQGSVVLVAGYGTIGALLARICKTIYHCEVYILEEDSEKIKMIQKHGYQAASDCDTFFDVAFNCTAHETALQYCIDRVGEEGMVVELSWYGTKKVTLCLGDSFHSMRKRIISSQVSKIPKSKREEWTYEKRKALAFSYLQDPFFDLLLTNEVPFLKSAEFFMDIRHKKANGIGFYIKY